MRFEKLAGLATAASLALGSILQAQDQAHSVSNPTVTTRQSVPDQPAAHPIWVGIDASPLSAALAHQLRLKPGAGLVIDRVSYDSPAARAGIREFDVLLKLDGGLIEDSRQFMSLLAGHRPGDAVTFTLIREGQPIDAMVTLAELAAPPPLSETVPAWPAPVASPRHRSRGLRIPKIKLRIDERGDLVATDASGHTLFRQPLDFTVDTPGLPFTVRVEPKPADPGRVPLDSGR